MLIIHNAELKKERKINQMEEGYEADKLISPRNWFSIFYTRYLLNVIVITRATMPFHLSFTTIPSILPIF